MAASAFNEQPSLDFKPADFAVEEFRKDHRKRLKQRFMQGGGDAMPDYEILELRLCLSIPRRDVKPLAHKLIKEFGSFAEALSAEPARLMKIKGIGPSVAQDFKVIEAAAHRFQRAQIMNKEVIASWDQLVRYCRSKLAFKGTEQFRVLFLDNKNQLIADEALQDGTVNHVPVYPREVAKRALLLNATALILVHNHPSGDPEPSQADIDMTHQVSFALTALGMTLHDHIIVGKSDIASFHSLDLL